VPRPTRDLGSVASALRKRLSHKPQRPHWVRSEGVVESPEGERRALLSFGAPSAFHGCYSERRAGSRRRLHATTSSCRKRPPYVELWQSCRAAEPVVAGGGRRAVAAVKLPRRN
jgi:hypothetical protein